LPDAEKKSIFALGKESGEWALFKPMGRVPGRLLLILTATVMGVTAAPGAPAAEAATAPHVSLSTAGHAFDSTFPGFAVAFAHKNLVGVSKYATPEMAQAVVGYNSCGCATWSMHISTVRFSIPIQQQYPLTFLAEVVGRDNAHKPMLEEVVLDKASPDEAWRVAYMVDLEDANPFLGPSIVASPPPIPFSMNIVGGELASFFQSVVNSGEPAANNNWPLTGALGQLVDHYVGVKLNIEREGTTEQVAFVPNDQSASFRYPSGAIMCGTIDSTAIVSAPAGYLTVQPANQSTWGPLLQPGAYSNLKKYSVEDYCFRAETNGLTVPISFFGGVDQIVGTP
jgi:hypothetical protein